MYKLVFLPVAQQDMINIVKYIGSQLQNPTAAEKIKKTIDNCGKM